MDLPFPCLTCTKKFETFGQLVDHAQHFVHYFYLPFSCEPCKLPFKSKLELDKHKRHPQHRKISKISSKPDRVVPYSKPARTEAPRPVNHKVTSVPNSSGRVGKKPTAQAKNIPRTLPQTSVRPPSKSPATPNGRGMTKLQVPDRPLKVQKSPLKNTQTPTKQSSKTKADIKAKEAVASKINPAPTKAKPDHRVVSRK